MQFTFRKPVRESAVPRGSRDKGVSALAQRVQDCALTGGHLVGSADPDRARLGEAIRVLMAEYTKALATPDGAAILLEPGSRWPQGHPELFEALLQAGRAAAAVGTEELLRLALRVTDTVLEARRKSRAGWRLRGRVLEALGEDLDAIDAHERYRELCAVDDVGIGARITGLRESRKQLGVCLELLLDRCPAAAEAAGRDPVELWSRGLELRGRGEPERAEPLLVAALAAMVEAERPIGELGSALVTVIDTVLEGTGPGPESAELFGAFSDHRRLLDRDPAPEPLLGGTRVIGVSDFRNLVAGRSICLVANSQRVADGRMGAEIDSYDLVVRFNSFRLSPRATGERTDIHATIHKHNFNWDVPVDTRLVFSGSPSGWQQSVRRRLVPGAQRHVNDRSLRWPVREIGQLGEQQWPSIPTSGFNMAFLLDFLDVSPRIDLIGFDFYASGAYRLPAAMKLPITSVHGYQREREWFMARAKHTDEMRIALR